MAIAKLIGGIGAGLGATLTLLLLAAAGLELLHRQRRQRQLELTAGIWDVDGGDGRPYRLKGALEFRNLSAVLDIAVRDVDAEATLISKSSLDGIACKVRIAAVREDEPPRNDGYWTAYILGSGETTGLNVFIDIDGADLSQLQTVWVRVRYVVHGIEGERSHLRHAVVPLQRPGDTDPQPLPWQSKPGAHVLPIKTHLLTHADDPVAIAQRYAVPHAQPGDVVTIGETPVAIMQERIRHPDNIQPGWLAKRLCHLFGQTANLATAGGLQTLIDLVGPVRVVVAFFFGAVAKLVGKSGVFYQLAGEQARLIDDVSGTIPPYDRFILLGPHRPEDIVRQIQAETSLAAAIVDVNDLRAVKILAATPDVDRTRLEDALRSNPAGNADEQTPVVLVRPVSSPEGDRP